MCILYAARVGVLLVILTSIDILVSYTGIYVQVIDKLIFICNLFIN